MVKKLTLYGYWRSGTSYRTRIALNLKGVDYDYHAIDLRTGDHKSDAFLKKNPQGLVPMLEADGICLFQSPAILEWLEETYPTPPLLPANKEDRAWVRALAAIVGCDTHPLNNLRILKYLKGPLGQEQAAIDGWIANWIHESFKALERMTEERGGMFLFGDTPTLADCYIVPQVYSAERFNVPLDTYPALMRVVNTAHKHPAFQEAHPDNQPDAD